MPTEEDIRKIIALHESGKSQRDIAREFDKSVGWVNGVLKKLNVSIERSQTKNATAAKRIYDRARRLELNDRLFERLEKFLDSKVSARDYKDLMVSYGILEDKRSLLDPIMIESNGRAAIDIFVEELKREAAEDEPKATEEHLAERQEA